MDVRWGQHKIRHESTEVVGIMIIGRASLTRASLILPNSEKASLSSLSVSVRGRFATNALCSIFNSLAPPRSLKLPTTSPAPVHASAFAYAHRCDFGVTAIASAPELTERSKTWV
jgi:hypothetical protein